MGTLPSMWLWLLARPSYAQLRPAGTSSMLASTLFQPPQAVVPDTLPLAQDDNLEDAGVFEEDFQAASRVVLPSKPKVS